VLDKLSCECNRERVSTRRRKPESACRSGFIDPVAETTPISDRRHISRIFMRQNAAKIHANDRLARPVTRQEMAHRVVLLETVAAGSRYGELPWGWRAWMASVRTYVYIAVYGARGCCCCIHTSTGRRSVAETAGHREDVGRNAPPAGTAGI